MFEVVVFFFLMLLFVVLYLTRGGTSKSPIAPMRRVRSAPSVPMPPPVSAPRTPAKPGKTVRFNDVVQYADC